MTKTDVKKDADCLYCMQCHGTNLWAAKWYELNTGLPVDTVPPINAIYCKDCDMETGIMYVSKQEEETK